MTNFLPLVTWKLGKIKIFAESVKTALSKIVSI